jgi:acetyl esterase/lipase
MAKKLKDGGVETELIVWKNMPHVFHFSWQILPEAKKAVQGIAKYVDAKIEQNEKSRELNDDMSIAS